MFRPIKLICVLICFLISTLISVDAAVYQKVPGTAVYISVPDNFELTNQFSGFVDKKTDATILVATMPPASTEMQSVFNDEGKFKREMVKQQYDIARQSYTKTRDGFLLTIYQGKQTSGHSVYDKWSTMIFAPNATYVVTIQAPEKISLSDSTAMAIFKSLSVTDNNQPSDQLNALPFTFTPQPPFVFVGSIMNSSAMLTIPTYGEEEIEQPDIILSKGLEILKGQPLDKVVDTYLKSLDGIVDQIKRRETTTTKFAGHDGLRFQAIARMKGKPVDLVIYAAIANDGRPIFMHATTKEGSFETYSVQIEKIAKSVSLRTDAAQQ